MCRVTARNLPCAVVELLGASIAFVEEDAFPFADKLIEEITLEE